MVSKTLRPYERPSAKSLAMWEAMALRRLGAVLAFGCSDNTPPPGGKVIWSVSSGFS